MSSNAKQIEYWNSKVGDTWVKMQERLDLAFTPVTVALLSIAAPQNGEDILDVGCGSGETTLALADAVGDEGTTIGIDLSEQLLLRARERAEELFIDAEFRNADAATYNEEDGFDLVISRFGVMFFADQVAAFANFHRLAVPGGRLCFACWQSADKNLWATLPVHALVKFIPEVPAVDPLAAGPFAFADPERVQSILTAAGWQDITFHDLPFAMIIGAGDDPMSAAVQFSMRIGPAARLVREAGAVAEAAAPALLASALAPYYSDDVVRLPAAVWLVTARVGLRLPLEQQALGA